LTVAKAHRVHQDGIHFQGFRYIDLTLSAYVGEDIVIRYDPREWPSCGSTSADDARTAAANAQASGSGGAGDPFPLAAQ
jgi:hypothetical protein